MLTVTDSPSSNGNPESVAAGEGILTYSVSAWPLLKTLPVPWSAIARVYEGTVKSYAPNNAFFYQ